MIVNKTGWQSRVKNKVKLIKVACGYMRSMYLNRPFLASYVPSRLFYISLWMLAPVALFSFQQLQLDPIQIQMVSSIAVCVSAIYGPINGIITDKVLKEKSYLSTALDRTVSYVSTVGRTLAPNPQLYTHAVAFGGFNGGELDWSNKFGMTVSRGKLMSTIKQVLSLVNLCLSTCSGFIGVGLYATYGPTTLLVLTSILATAGIGTYIIGSKKYKDYWIKKSIELN